MRIGGSTHVGRLGEAGSGVGQMPGSAEVGTGDPGAFLDQFMLELKQPQEEQLSNSGGWVARTPITGRCAQLDGRCVFHVPTGVKGVHDSSLIHCGLWWDRVASPTNASPASVRAKEEVVALKQSTLSLEATMGSPLKELRTLLEMPFMKQGEEDGAADEEERELRSGISDWFRAGTPLANLPQLPELPPHKPEVPYYPEIRDFLEDIGLQESYREFVVELGAMKVQDLYNVEEADLERLGLKKLEIKRFLDSTAAEDDDAVFEEIERELLEAGEEEVEEQRRLAVRPDSPGSFGGSLHSADETLFAEAREVAERAEAKVDEAVIAAEERTAKLAADVAALSAEMEAVRSMSRQALEEGVPPEPEPAATTPMPSPEEMLLAAQARAAATKMENTIEQATRWSARDARRESENEMLEAEVASDMLTTEVEEFVALVDRAATSPAPVNSSARHQAVQRAARAANDAMVDLEKSVLPMAPAMPSPRTRVQTLQSAEELEVELATKELALTAKDAEIKVMQSELKEAQVVAATASERMQQRKMPSPSRGTVTDAITLNQEKGTLSGSAADALRGDAALAAAEVEQWNNLAERVIARVGVMQTEAASNLRKVMEKSDMAAAAAEELECWTELTRKAGVTEPAVVSKSVYASPSSMGTTEQNVMRAAVDAALESTDTLIESNIILRQKLQVKNSEQRQALQEVVTTASLLAQSSAAIRSMKVGPEQPAKFDDAPAAKPRAARPEAADTDVAYWKAKYEASQQEIEQNCTKVEELSSNLEKTLASAAKWQSERQAVEQKLLASQQRIAELEQSLESERNDCEDAKNEIKRWMSMRHELTAQAEAAAGAESDLASPNLFAATTAQAEAAADAVSDLASPNLLAATAAGDAICNSAVLQASERLTLRPQLTATFLRDGPLGINLTSCRDNEGVMILAVQPNSQAAVDHGTKLRAGLVLSEVAGQSMDGLSHEQVSEVISGHRARPLVLKFWASDGDEDNQEASLHTPGHMVKYLNSPSAYE